MKVLAIDFGMKRMGFAIGNTLLNTAAPLDPISGKNPGQVLHYIQQLIAEYDITRVLVGYPLNMDGTKSTATRAVEKFTRQLKMSLDPEIPTEFIDERLSSFEAEEELKILHPGYKKRKKYMDSMSALVILRRFMEKK